jgi:hypothetical protein
MAGIERDARVRHPEYGDGTIEAVADDVLTYWDQPLHESAGRHRLYHTRAFVAGLEILSSPEDP